MSHACVLVAVDVVNPRDRSEIEAAVAFQMAPYDEKEEWFRDGSRWDWYQIGGRFTGLLSDYDPEKDPENIQECETCYGTGTRPGGREQFGEAWFRSCNGCNGCRGTGKRVMGPTQWKQHHGDVAQVKNLDPKQFKAAYAFLRERHWHEGERMGWFGAPARTECEMKNPNNPESLTRRCVTTGDENAKIVVWNEPHEIWEQSYFQRFIKPLDQDTVLVVVDYHV